MNGMTPSIQYNGNIVAQTWGPQGAAASAQKTFIYKYDQLNRLTDGISSDNYNENNISYDLAGNIASLKRTTGSTALTDDLIYSYTLGGFYTMQLQNIADATTSDIGQKHGSFSYAYDGNGNLITDNSKGITGSTGITYNLLNLPQAIASKNTSYTYDATGQKLRRVIGTTPTDYVSGIQYDNGLITFIQTEEGRALVNGAVNYNYEYSLTDHLGNSRVTFDSFGATAIAKQTDDYYAFGMEISRGAVPSIKNEYLFNKKEVQENLGLYDYGARLYDPVVARWTGVDPLAETSRKLSPYNYGNNNPIRFTDPDGMQTQEEQEDEEWRAAAIERSKEIGRQISQTKGPGTMAETSFEVKPAGIEKSNTFVNENGEIVKKAGKFAGWLEFAGYVVIELFGSHDDPAVDLQNAYDNARKNDFKNATTNKGFANELLRNGYGNRGEDEDDNKKFIYRGGNPGDGNLTPRPELDTKANSDKRGLSTFTTAAEAKQKSGKPTATKISVASLRNLGLQVYYKGTHVSIRPATQQELETWAATRQRAIDGKGSHIYTKLVQASVRGVE
jgi:RHS repeat-associated protein